MHAPRSIVIVKLSSIGDVLHGVPVAVAAKRAFPDCRVGWVVEGRAADVLAGHPAIDHLFRMPRGWLKSAGQVLSLRRQLRDFAADVAIDLQGLLKSGVATWLSGAPVRIGHARPASRERAWLAYTHPVAAALPHVVEQNCDLLGPLGVVASLPEFDMPHWPVSRLRMQQWLAAQRLGGPPAIINPGAGWPSKLWPVDRFAAVARGRRRVPCSAPHFLQNRTLPPSAPARAPSRVALPQAEHTKSTFEASIGISLLSRPPCGFFWLRFKCR